MVTLDIESDIQISAIDNNCEHFWGFCKAVISDWNSHTGPLDSPTEG